MIAAIRQKLNEMGKNCCENNSLIGQEKSRGVRLTPSTNGEVIKINVDGCLITDSQRCDCLYFYQQSIGKRHVFLVELKGNNYRHALEQLISTKAHSNYAALHEVAKPCKEWAVAIVSERARTNLPKKQEWEDENNIRLRVVPVRDDGIYDLRELTKKPNNLRSSVS